MLVPSQDAETRKTAGIITNAGEISLERDSDSDISDDELDKAIVDEVSVVMEDGSKWDTHMAYAL